MENRHGLIVDAQATVADGFAEREAASDMLATHWRHTPDRRRTVGADKGTTRPTSSTRPLRWA
jgi:hypothetical protein